MEGSKFYYKARYKYVPENDGEDDSDIPDIPMEVGDLLEVSAPLEDPNENPENPQGWLKGYNKTQKVYGYFPGNHVEAVKMEEILPQSQPDNLILIFLNQEFNNERFKKSKSELVELSLLD
ncbi:hypothetical protein FSP39_004862 [Pinctada imbricata]|uniref:SH3 domain-containing protein n=1 Tax=Pinctada imbricata TaxID=66713 RepID=A0AA89BSL8_PINIB|nr:hypothetical protein FSP39_004862 [Pinctada imbricata]